MASLKQTKEGPFLFSPVASVFVLTAHYTGPSSPAVTNVPASLPFMLQLTGQITGEMGGKVDIDEVSYFGWRSKRTGK